MSKTIANRYDFVLLFDVKDGNPNGDPDAGNMPRFDAETADGLVTDVALKRKIRNYVAMRHDYKPPFDIYIKEKAVLTAQHERAYEACGLSITKQKDKKRTASEDEARQWMCKNFYDVRTFGAVMSLQINCGQVRGPVQMTFARSIGPVMAQEHSITRMAVATQQEADKQQGDNRTMGRKHTIPYGLYRAHGFISAHFAEQTMFSDDDLELFWEALTNMFDHDRSAARGEMTTRGLYIFKHSNKLGSMPAHQLFEHVKVLRKNEQAAARSFDDFQVQVKFSSSDKVELIRKIG